MLLWYKHNNLYEQKSKTIAATEDLNQAISLLEKSYNYDNKDQNTLCKLSTVHLLKGNCPSAWRYCKECMALGGQPIAAGYTEHLKKTCK